MGLSAFGSTNAACNNRTMRKASCFRVFPLAGFIILLNVCAQAVCLQSSEEQRAQCDALENVNYRYKSCKEIYSNPDVVTLFKNQTPIDPMKARPCIWGPSIPAVYYVP